MPADPRPSVPEGLDFREEAARLYADFGVETHKSAQELIEAFGRAAAAKALKALIDSRVEDGNYHPAETADRMCVDRAVARIAALTEPR